MLRHIIRNFSRHLSQNYLRNHETISLCEKNQQRTRDIFLISTAFYTSTTIESNPFDSDDYIGPLKSQAETKDSLITSREGLLEALRYKFRMNSDHLKKISAVDLKFPRNGMRDINKVLDILLERGISKYTIVENPWILTTSPRLLEAKIDIVERIVGEDISDVVPFLKLSGPRLLKVVELMLKETDEIPGGNRLYYISKQLNLEPKVVSQYLSKRLFMIEMPFEMLRENLENMVSFGVAPLNILRDLWAFRYTPKSVKSRLERAKNAKKEKIMPWMVRCPEKRLQKSLKLSLDERNLLGDPPNIVNYIGKRLGYDEEMMHAIMSRHPAAFKVRATKVKDVLDYLLIEEGFEPYQIANVIRILCHSLKTTKKRIQELKEHNCTLISLAIVCKSETEYQKFSRDWIRYKKVNKVEKQ